MKLNDLTVVVFCNKKDFFLAKICIASIRYFYPEIPIELVKDFGNGHFRSTQLEGAFNVKSIDLGVPKLGWGASKIFYLATIPSCKKVLLLDADIVFISPFLERLKEVIVTNDWVVNYESVEDPCDAFIAETYFDFFKIKEAYPKFTYPGFVFNTGQLFVTGGAVSKDDLEPFFDFEHYPFWKQRQLFPMVDQSMLNILLPILSSENKLILGTEKFMLWGMSDATKHLSLDDIKEKKLTDGLIHWAGCLRIPHVSKMSRGDILLFFENYYYEKIPLGQFRKSAHRTISCFDFYLRGYYRQSIKKVIGRIFRL